MKKLKRNERRCATCDEWYDPAGDRAKVHEHPEPQSGDAREAWLRSKMPYEQWAKETEAGRTWAQLHPRTT